MSNLQQSASFWFDLDRDWIDWQDELSYDCSTSTPYRWTFYLYDSESEFEDHTWGYVLHGPSPA